MEVRLCWEMTHNSLVVHKTDCVFTQCHGALVTFVGTQFLFINNVILVCKVRPGLLVT